MNEWDTFGIWVLVLIFGSFAIGYLFGHDVGYGKCLEDGERESKGGNDNG